LPEEKHISKNLFIVNIRNELFSVLDLVDHSSFSQKSSFSDEAWTQIISSFESELDLELPPLPRTLASSWLII